ncbi:D-alanyl-D-alanine carboxypeptidase/D-alanyl-D-alanine endopeptidase [Lentibacter sp.]|uniref:D-alanyl-D-alanine carboxypeptidase/D-alanyl-D-alanine endopeptidase n=1 Tax=Lentibacter sp. TaxID=2024994 RepID=UPI003F6A5299
MMRMISKRFFLVAGLSAMASAGLARAPERSLRPQSRPAGGAVPPKTPSAAALIARAELGGDVGFAVADARTGLVLESGNARLGLPPASVTKAVTALYALESLGAGHRFYTELRVAGPIRDGVLQGDVILKGGGDPTLDTDRLAEFVRALKAAGLREVKGRLIVDGTALPSLNEIDSDQPEHVGYNPAISGIALNFNRVHFEWTRANGVWNVMMDGRSERYRPEVRFAKMQIANRDAPVFTYGRKGQEDHWSVSAQALGKGGSRWLPVRQPELYAGDVLRALARAEGLRLPAPEKGVAAGGAPVLLRLESADLRSICKDFLKYSNNMMTEMVGLAATTARSGRPVSLKASAGEMSRWARVSLGMGASRFVDHSGLGEASRATAEDMTKALVAARPVIAPLLKPVAMRDAKGRVIKAHPMRVHAKTGTLNFVSALAGYAEAPDGTVMSFAIFAADRGRRARLKRSEREAPPGARSWNRRAKGLQQALIERWGALYGA